MAIGLQLSVQARLSLHANLCYKAPKLALSCKFSSQYIIVSTTVNMGQ